MKVGCQALRRKGERHGPASAGKQHTGAHGPPCGGAGKAEPRHRALRRRRPDGRGAVHRRRPRLRGGGQALSAVPSLPEGAGGHPPRRRGDPGHGAPGVDGGRGPRPAAGRVHPAQRGGAEGIHHRRQPPTQRAGPERAAEDRGGRAVLRGVHLLRGQPRRRRMPCRRRRSSCAGPLQREGCCR